MCLICKGQVGDYMFMCTKSNALYCCKYAQGLITLKSIYWVCNTAIDPSKSIKSQIELEKKEELEIEPQNQKKN